MAGVPVRRATLLWHLVYVAKTPLCAQAWCCNAAADGEAAWQVTREHFSQGPGYCWWGVLVNVSSLALPPIVSKSVSQSVLVNVSSLALPPLLSQFVCVLPCISLPAFYCTMDFPKYGELMQRILFASSK